MVLLIKTFGPFIFPMVLFLAFKIWTIHGPFLLYPKLYLLYFFINKTYLLYGFINKSLDHPLLNFWTIVYDFILDHFMLNL